MLNAVAEGVVMVAMQSFVQYQLCNGSSSRAVAIVSIGWIGYNLCNFVANIVLGSLSDKVGRRPMVILGTVTRCMGYVWITFNTDVTIFILVYSGMGLFDVSQLASLCVIADESLSEKRPGADADTKEGRRLSNRISKLYLAYAGGMVGGVVIGVLADFLSATMTMALVASLYALSGAFIYVYLEETLKVKPVPITWGAILSSCNLKATMDSFSELEHSSKLQWLAVVMCILVTSGVGFCMTLFYWLEDQFGMNTADYGVVLGIIIVSSGMTFSISNNYWTIRYAEDDVLMGCLAGTGFLMLIMAFVRERWQVYLIACFGGVGSNTIVLLRAIITRSVAATVQGRVQGLMYCLQCVAFVVGPVIYTYVFEYGEESSFILVDGDKVEFFAQCISFLLTAWIVHIIPKTSGGDKAASHKTASGAGEETTTLLTESRSKTEV